jgi:hypothetical protein
VERAASLARREGADVCDRSRWSVLNWAGATLAGAAAFGFDPLSLRLTEALAKNGVVDLDTGDIALLNYAYALEQLEAAFYTAVMASPYSGMTRYERSVLSDVKGHEIAHADVFQNYETFIGVAQTFEDTGVAAFKGQLPSFAEHGEVLTTALKIHSVEARHAAEVRHLRAERAWVGAFDKPMTKEQVLAVAKPFFAH